MVKYFEAGLDFINVYFMMIICTNNDNKTWLSTLKAVLNLIVGVLLR